ncbi:hypothetical protein DEU56DRAFT_915527 [Suillus clintonianus]|uniref:uncharacterized protein n=1 Tax=Suillus clintonianus TaxID=1904413 RepID=UPI001B885DD2|nr:uncharacterized protein DEU56DRAFT_915527 [Suillus clintonianus]KAG2128263.1 hypothetical protein DEU56DRAFT_915527 [Suillus clintonianus]
MYDVFLATPLLPSGALYREVKFSGNEQLNKDMIGHVVDAYSHHVLVDSTSEILISDIQGIIAPDHSVILFDPQAHMYVPFTAATIFSVSISDHYYTENCHKHCHDPKIGL